MSAIPAEHSTGNFSRKEGPFVGNHSSKNPEQHLERERLLPNGVSYFYDKYMQQGAPFGAGKGEGIRQEV